MKLKSLNKFEVLNNETVSMIGGGLAADSRKQDSKKHDDFDASIIS